MNQLILEDVETQGAFITAFIAILDRSNSSLVYANCGHPPAYLLTKQGIEPLPSKGMALGVDQEFKFDLQTITLAAQDKVFIYTDGVIEAHNAHNEMYSLDRLELFLNTYKDQTGAALIDTLQKDLDLFCDKTDLHDDLTMLCIEKKG
jgi:sigma-B regulation protein RsbU (phosphoserine phosphatase)